MQDEFQRTFPNTSAPNKITIRRLVKKFAEIGEVSDKPHIGKPVTATTPRRLTERKHLIDESL